jgi:hypothetical protein
MGQTVQQGSGVRNIENRLGQKGARHAGAIMRRPSATPSAGHHALQLEQRQSPHESLMALTHGPQFLGQHGELVALEKICKCAEESGYAIHGGRRVQSKFCSSQIFYGLAVPPNTFSLDFVFVLPPPNKGLRTGNFASP